VASSSADVLRVAVTLAVLFVLASLGLFVVYVTATMRLLQVSWVVTAVADETRAALRVNLPPADDYRDVPPPGPPRPQRALMGMPRPPPSSRSRSMCDCRPRRGPARASSASCSPSTGP